MKKSKKFEKAKFYCESCGAEVPQNARVCTNCGKFFSSVKCPKCGRTGKTEEFIHGCPKCGYAVSNYHHSNLGLNNGSYGAGGSLFKRRRFVDSGLPIWVYIICIVVLIILVIGLYSCL